jgi:hypothetical protein
MCKPHTNHKYSLVIITPRIFSSKMLYFGWWERSWLDLYDRYNLTVCNKLLRACCNQLVNNLWRADDIRLLEQLVASLLVSSTLLQDDNNLFQTCQQLGTSSANTSCWQAVRFLGVYRVSQKELAVFDFM